MSSDVSHPGQGLEDPRLRLSGLELAGIAALTAACVWIFWQFLFRQFRSAILNEADWGHTLIIPGIVAYLVWHNREQLRKIQLRTTWLGLAPVVIGVGWYMLVSLHPALQNHNLQAMGVWSVIVGLTLLFCGFKAMAWLWFPLIYLFVFGQSISNRGMELITYRLQDLAAFGSYLSMNVVGLDVERSGNTLTIYGSDGVGRPVNVAEACSGMRMLMAFLALGVAMAYTGFRRTWQRTALIMMAVPTALVVNILRIITLSLLSLMDTEFAAGDFHTLIGLVWLVPALLMYMGEMWVIRNLVVEGQGKKPSTKRGSGSSSSKPADREQSVV